MSNKAQILRCVSAAEEPVTYTNKVAFLIQKLRELGYSDEHILDLYIEILRSKKSGKITSFTKLIQGADGTKTVLPEVIKSFKDMIISCREIDILDFLTQFTAFVKGDCYDTILENKVVGDEFYRLSGTEDELLIVNPHPAFVEKCLQQKNKTKVTFTFSDDKYVQIFQFSNEREKYVSLTGLHKGRYNRAMYFARNATPQEIENVLNFIRFALTPEKQSIIYVYLPTTYLEKNRTFKDYLIDHFTVSKIILFGRDIVTIKPLKKSLMVLNNAPTTRKEDVQIQKVHQTNKSTLAFMEFRKVKFEIFKQCNRTLSELYDTEFVDYSTPKLRKRPDNYQFTPEFSIYVSVTEDKEHGFRPQYSIYDYPTNAQERKNKYPRGALIKRMRGKWYPTREEAIESAENVLLNDKQLSERIRKCISRQYYKKPISLKTQLFIHLEDLRNCKSYDEDFIMSVFFQPNSINLPLCNLLIGAATAEDIQRVVDSLISEQMLSERKAKLLWEILKFLLDCAVADERYQKNPITELLNVRSQGTHNKKAVRRNLTKPSFSEEQERKFLQIVMSKIDSPIYVMILVRYFTGLAVNLLRAMTVADFVFIQTLNLYQLSITKTCHARNEETYPLPRDLQRFFPLPVMIAEVIIAYLKERKAKPRQCLFALPQTPSLPISERQFWRKFNEVMEQMDLPEFKISIADGDNVPEQTDIDNYGGDFLRANFIYHAREDALMNIGDIKMLLGTHPSDSGRRFYLSYKDPFVQLILRTKLDRWVARLMLTDEAKITMQETGDEYIVRGAPRSTLSELVITGDIAFDPNVHNISDIQEMLLSVYAEYGATISFSFLEED